MTDPIEIKGIGTDLLVSMPAETTWETANQLLMEKIRTSGAFFKGASVILQLREYPLQSAELGKLRDQLSELGVRLKSILSDNPQTRTAAQALALGIDLPSRSNTPVIESFDINLQSESAIFLRQTLRSGHTVQHDGHIIIFGDVNPGAEVIANGNVIVWGRLLGMVHAGANGDATALVSALDLSPTQLRIADRIATTPQRTLSPEPETALIKGAEIVAERWHPASAPAKPAKSSKWKFLPFLNR
jgi:septum site-determining protein MinC